MPSTIVLTSNNIVDTANNSTFVYNFPSAVNFDNHEIAIESISLNYAWENVRSVQPFNNNLFRYQWQTGSLVIEYDVLLPDGLYEVTDINAFFQYEMMKRGHFLINASGQNVFYAEFVVNTSTFSVDINTYPVPTSLPTGFSTPTADSASYLSGWGGFPPNQFNPSINLVSTNNFHKLIGHTNNLVTGLNLSPLATFGKNLSFSSTTAPEIHPNTNVFLSINNIQNIYANPSSIIHNFVASGSFGSQILDRPNEFAFNNLIRGQYNELRVQILGSNFQPLKILDPSIVIVMLIREQGQQMVSL